jgi:hypothetical protein
VSDSLQIAAGQIKVIEQLLEQPNRMAECVHERRVPTDVGELVHAGLIRRVAHIQATRTSPASTIYRAIADDATLLAHREKLLASLASDTVSPSATAKKQQTLFTN